MSILRLHFIHSISMEIQYVECFVSTVKKICLEKHLFKIVAIVKILKNLK